ncbi:SusC/RagA family TonB-linked outer membrane protein [Hymenobacter qilianensis]|uniref:SusC/RagA family TonB-linked outer membrane protein n=2 Tax=Hymenobacter qilianensis TaxID=1385715 RepID=A0ACB5PLA0_9BACT|nr:SusC/RagA family TonB-linked outer membrane protein [Hymenobacter qilianensis]QNP50872.1 SusC/RagA family TonB-linked outer membrane protein [Hymenobacter qilianensis]GGF49925.1 SusC/RagA family TonB-linked outer membrane protein [Hymenobacter qilianensis]
MKKLLFMVILLMTSLLQQAIAQDRTVTGRVTDRSTGEGLPGVTVLVKGTSVGSSTNSEGAFSISVPASATTLTFSSIGYVNVERAIGTESVIDVSLGTDTKQLGEVVVTALGRTEEKRSLGYSVQDVQGEVLTQARESNVVNSLAGRVAGVSINNSNGGSPGSSSRIVIRGNRSITGNNQPLFVVNGLPIDNSNFSPANGSGGVDYGNAASDINPDDIESITVLKGANAAALYGSRASNGVVLITTKSGRKQQGLGVSVNSTTTFDSVLKLPDFQNEYGQGNGGEFEFVDGAGGGVNDGSDESWGPRLDGRLIPQFNSPVDAAGNRIPTPWVANPDNVRDFFRTGRTLNNNVSLSGSSEKANFRLSYTNLDQTGILENTFLKRNTVSVSGGTDITKKFKVSTDITYTQNRGRRPGLGYSGQNVMQQFSWFGRQVDISELKDYERDGEKYNWNYNYHNNPYFTLNENTNDDRRDRINGQLSATYMLTNWLNLTARTGNDLYTEKRQRRIAVGDIENLRGSYAEDEYYVNERNSEILATANKDLNENFNIDFALGANRRDNKVERISGLAPELAVPGVYTLSNSAIATQPSSVNNRLRVNSVYGSAKLGFKNFAFLGVTGRNDWYSTLADANNSLFYPSIDGSLIVTEALGIENSFLSFAKLRASYAEVGNGGQEPYQLVNIYPFNTPFGSNPAITTSNDLLNPDLRPERTESLEAGIELRFLENRIGLELTGYKTNSIDQIFNQLVSSSTGFATALVNAGVIQNKGIEAILNFAPLNPENPFQWNVTANFALNRNEVKELNGDLKTLVLGGQWNANVEARVGEPYGVLFGNGFQRVQEGPYKGQIINDATGRPIIDPTRKVLGNVNPDWTGGISNSFSFKGINLGVLIDTRQGGDVYSVSNTWGNYAGTFANSLRGRENGIIGEGVIANADGTYRPNDVTRAAESYTKRYYSNSVAESSIYDASFVKLREIKVGYQLPKGLISKTPFSTIGLSVVGRNLAILQSNAPNIDPETSFSSGNAQGLEFGQIPSTRSIGFNVNLTL